MLKTNSKKAAANIMLYIRQDLDYLEERKEYREENGKKFTYNLENDNDICAFIWDIFTEEKGCEIAKTNWSLYSIFKDWAQGLALGGLFCYYYNRSAVEDLGNILEETEEEKAKYTEEEAEEMLTRLLYKTISGRRAYSL